MSGPSHRPRAGWAVAAAAGAVMTVSRSWQAGRSAGRSAGRIDVESLEREMGSRLPLQLEHARRTSGRFTISLTPLGDATPLVACDVERHVRSLDAVGVIGHTLIVMWWNTDRSGAASAIDRLIAEAVLWPSAAAATGLATFPTDGLTVASLLEAARSGPGSRPALRAVPNQEVHGRPTGESAGVIDRRLDAVVRP